MCVRVLVSAQNVSWKNANVKSGDMGKRRSAGTLPGATNPSFKTHSRQPSPLPVHLAALSN